MPQPEDRDFRSLEGQDEAAVASSESRQIPALLQSDVTQVIASRPSPCPCKNLQRLKLSPFENC